MTSVLRDMCSYTDISFTPVLLQQAKISHSQFRYYVPKVTTEILWTKFLFVEICVYDFDEEKKIHGQNSDTHWSTLYLSVYSLMHKNYTQIWISEITVILSRYVWRYCFVKFHISSSALGKAVSQINFHATRTGMWKLNWGQKYEHQKHYM